MCKDGIKKAKAQMKLSLERDVKNNKGFCRYIAQKRKAKDCVSPVMDEKGKLVSTNTSKAQALNNLLFL